MDEYDPTFWDRIPPADPEYPEREWEKFLRSGIYADPSCRDDYIYGVEHGPTVHDVYDGQGKLVQEGTHLFEEPDAESTTELMP